MALTLRELLSYSNHKYDIKIIAGTLGLNRPCRWIHVVEDDDVPSFLHGYELIFTTGIGISSKPTFSLTRFAETLLNRKCSGWVLNLGPYITKVPQDVIDLCNRKGLPLFTIPWEKRLTDVTYELSHILIENEKIVISVSKAFSNIIFSLGEERVNYSTIERVGINSTDRFRILNIKVDKSDTITSITGIIESIESNFKRSEVSVFSEADNLIVISIDNEKKYYNDLVEKIMSILDEYKIKYHIGVSNSKNGLDQLPLLYSQSNDALKTSQILDNVITKYSECGIYQLLFKVSDNNVRINYVNYVLGKIADYDIENSTDYLKVLEDYIATNGSVNKLAEMYGVHRNTINYRIKFLKDNFGLNLNYEDIAELVISFKLVKIIDKKWR
jgi:hypothetical protein